MIVIPFPFSNLTATKVRPALVVASLAGSDMILCQITSQFVRDANAIELNTSDFSHGSLNRPSNVRPNRIWTGEDTIVRFQVGTISDDKLKAVIEAIVETLQS